MAIFDDFWYSWEAPSYQGSGGMRIFPIHRATRWIVCLLAAAWLVSPARLPAVEIVFYQRGYVEGGSEAATRLTDAAITEFQRRRPDVRVHIIGVPWGKEGDLKLRTALLASQRSTVNLKSQRGIDLFRLAHDQLPAFLPQKGRLLSPVDPYMTDEDRADFGPAALAALTHEGHIMAWPLWSTAISLVANPQILQRRGIEPPTDRPWTWEEFIGALRQATHPDDRGRPVYGLNAAARPPLFEWSPLLMAHCGPLFVEGAPPPEDGSLALAPNLAGALERVAALREKGLLTPSFGVDDQPAAQKSFLEGRVAFLLTSPGFLRTLEATRAPYLILPPPTGEWGRPITTGALGCVAVVDGGDPERVEAAHALARWLTSAEIDRAVPGWYLAPPARRSVATFYDQPGRAPLAAILPTARYGTPPVGPGFMERLLIPKLQAALLGQIPASQAVADIQSAARREALEPAD
jgi:multiple sugar transport system substrate-binding protein